MVQRVPLGILTPSSNTALEPLTTALLSSIPEASVHFSRFRVTEISLGREALGQFELDTILEAARLDGAGEVRIFFQVVIRSLAPGLVTVLLFTLVATWNNYFLPLIMLNDPVLYPITVGLATWSSQSMGGSGSTAELLALVVTGSLLSIIPLIAAFLLLQRFWQSGLTAGGVKG